jgi:hypothetical protein
MQIGNPVILGSAPDCRIGESASADKRILRHLGG